MAKKKGRIVFDSLRKIEGWPVSLFNKGGHLSDEKFWRKGGGGGRQIRPIPGGNKVNLLSPIFGRGEIPLRQWTETSIRLPVGSGKLQKKENRLSLVYRGVDLVFKQKIIVPSNRERRTLA